MRNEVVVHLSGGDISGVAAGTGLDGGGTNGSVALNLAPNYRLPQGCGDGQVPKQAGTSWVCGSDDNTTYTAGTGLTVEGSSFKVDPDVVQFRVAGGCAVGSAIRSIASDGTVTCEPDDDTKGTLTVVEVVGPLATLCSVLDTTCSSTGLSRAACPAGTVVTGGGWSSFKPGILHIRTSSKDLGNGWFVSGNNTSTVEGTDIWAYAYCASIS